MSKVREKFNEIHADLEANVTKIYQRRDLMTMVDLVAHSLLQFPFQGNLIRKGWVECLVLGDTRCGKTETATKMMEHYRCGEIVTGENASYAGLVGGLQQTQKVWSITWGKYPLNDRRMIAIDEVSGLDQMSISRMSGIRSSGVAEITKIQTERTLARVRSLWLTNPRGRKPIAAFNSGIDAIQDLIGHPEDIARFDAALTVATGEVAHSVINAAERPQVPHVYNTAACNRLVIWCWSRKAEHVVWKPGAERVVLEVATELSRKYVPPLVEGAEQRIKVARLACAVAARVFSTSDGEHLEVGREHVEFVHEFLDEIYTKPSMAFDIHSRARIEEQTLYEPEEVARRFEKVSDGARQLIAGAPFFGVADLQDYLGVSRDASIEFASFLVRHRCTKRGKFGYYKLPAFIQFLRGYRRARTEELPF